MTGYEELAGYMPPQRIVEALDDDGDGRADDAAWAAVRQGAEDRLATIFGPGGVPAEAAGLAEYARKLFALVLLYNRRGLAGEDNPYETEAQRAEARLRALASGEENTDGATTEPVIIGEPAKIAGTGGLLA